MNKTGDGRLIDKRVVIEKKLLENILLNIKKLNNLTWKQLGSKIGVCEHTVCHDWLKKGNTVPLSLFKKVLKMSEN